MKPSPFTKSYSEKEVMLKVPAFITNHTNGSTTRYIFKGEKNIRTNIDLEAGTLEVIITK